MQGKHFLSSFILVLTLFISVSSNIFFTVAVIPNNNQSSNEYSIPPHCNNVAYANADEPTLVAMSNFMLKLSPKLNRAVATGLAYIMLEASKKYNVNPLYVVTISFLESGFNPAAVSSSGARGIFQVMPFNKMDKGAVDLGINADDGVKILRECLDKTSNNCIMAYVCYIYGNKYKSLSLDDPIMPQTVSKLSLILMSNKIQNCGEFSYLKLEL